MRQAIFKSRESLKDAQNKANNQQDMEEFGQPRVIWDHEQAVMAGASSNLAILTFKNFYLYMDEIYNKIIELKNEGYSYKDISVIMGMTLNSVKYRCGNKYKYIQERKAKKLADDLEFERKVIEYIPQCNSINGVCRMLRVKSVYGYIKKINEIILKYSIDTSHFGTLYTYKHGRNIYTKIPFDEYFSKSCERDGKSMFNRLISENIKAKKCEFCGGEKWMGEDIPLCIHHKNHDHFDNRIENLMVVCENCHRIIHKMDSLSGKYKTKRTYVCSSTNHTKFEIEIPKKEITGYCVCGNPLFKKGQTFCSHECCSKNKRKYSYDDVDVIMDSIRKNRHWTSSAKELGLSDNGLRKITKRLGIYDEAAKIIKECP